MSAWKMPIQSHNLTRELMAAAGDACQKSRVAQAEQYFFNLSRQDYASHLAKNFDRSQIRELLADLRRSLPTLNRDVFRETQLNRLVSVGNELDVTVRVENLPAPGLRGFYVNDSAFSARPLIVLNGANSAVAVAAAFWHEIGHHLTHEIFGRSQERLNLTFLSSYENHLKDLDELLADIVMTLAAYPARTAKRLFAAKPKNDPKGSVSLVSKASGHLRSVSGFELAEGGPTKKKLHTVAGMIHLAKLRIALLEEYDI
jgi:hypothetical protein